MTFKLTIKLEFTTSPGGWVICGRGGCWILQNKLKPALTKVEVKV